MSWWTTSSKLSAGDLKEIRFQVRQIQINSSICPRIWTSTAPLTAKDRIQPLRDLDRFHNWTETMLIILEEQFIKTKQLMRHSSIHNSKIISTIHLSYRQSTMVETRSKARLLRRQPSKFSSKSKCKIASRYWSKKVTMVLSLWI
jgi:hypothetical protein